MEREEIGSVQNFLQWNGEYLDVGYDDKRGGEDEVNWVGGGMDDTVGFHLSNISVCCEIRSANNLSAMRRACSYLCS